MAKNQTSAQKLSTKSALKKGDIVMVIAGGSAEKRANKGKTGRILGFVGKERDRALVEGLNLIKRHQRPTAPGKPSGIISKESGIHLSNLMFFAEKISKPVKLRFRILADGKKVRGYTDPASSDFVQLEEKVN